MLSFSGAEYKAGEIWQYPVNDQLQAIMVPSLKAGEIYTEQFISSMANDNDIMVTNLLRKNDLTLGWYPVKPVYFHSGKTDKIVPHFNSVEAYNVFSLQGGNVKLYEYEGDHNTPVADYYLTMLEDFKKLQ
ncbi:MAG: hypothetical protein V7785_00680 [Bermanella sp.]